MSGVAFVFPGQGAQYVGMGRDFSRDYFQAQEVFETADKTLDFSLSKLCWEGPEEELKQTVNTQPAIVAVSLAGFKILTEEGFYPEVVAGHSVGEYAALVAAGVLDVPDALRLVRKRGQFMQEAGEKYPSTMAAILGLSREKTEAACKVASEVGVVEIANLNCPDQIVISGEINAVEKAREIALQMGAKRALPLAVSAAFHSSLMQEPAVKLARELDEIEFQEPQIPLVANESANYLMASAEIKSALKRQITSKVLWEDSIRAMLEKGVDTFVEIGPGTVLSGLVKKISKEVNVLNVQDSVSLEKTIRELSNLVLKS
ncbi:MAG: ACP S-malonyltransferase [Firmicutes bacterium]|nr:ACP S-malonyltransferase [Bacillota bacterium]